MTQPPNDLYTLSTPYLNAYDSADNNVRIAVARLHHQILPIERVWADIFHHHFPQYKHRPLESEEKLILKQEVIEVRAAGQRLGLRTTANYIREYYKFRRVLLNSVYQLFRYQEDNVKYLMFHTGSGILSETLPYPVYELGDWYCWQLQDDYFKLNLVGQVQYRERFQFVKVDKFIFTPEK